MERTRQKKRKKKRKFCRVVLSPGQESGDDGSRSMRCGQCGKGSWMGFVRHQIVSGQNPRSQQCCGSIPSSRRLQGKLRCLAPFQTPVVAYSRPTSGNILYSLSERNLATFYFFASRRHNAGLTRVNTGGYKNVTAVTWWHQAAKPSTNMPCQ